MHTTLLAYRSYSSGTAEVAAKTVTSWFNALDMPIKDQCGLFDVGALRYDQCGPLDAPKDNQCAPNEPVIASTEAFATVRVGITRTIALSVHLEYAPCSTNSCRALFSLHTLGQAVGVPDDASKRFGRSAPLDAVATERAGLRVDENEGVACPPWWLPPFMANHGQFHSDNEVLAHIDVHDGKPHRDLMSHESAEQPKPADSPSRDETIGLCMDFKRSTVHIHPPPRRLRFQWKGAHTPFLLLTACTLFSPAAPSSLHTCSPFPLLPAHLGPLPHPQRRVPHYVLTGPGA